MRDLDTEDYESSQAATAEAPGPSQAATAEVPDSAQAVVAEAPEPSQAATAEAPEPSQPISDEQGPSQTGQTAAAANKSRLPIVIAAGVAIAVLVAFVIMRSGADSQPGKAAVTAESAPEESGSAVVDSSYTGPTVNLNYLLDDDSQDLGEARIAPDSQGYVTLPECAVECEGYAFIGWADEYPQQKLQDEPIEPGTQIAMDDAAYTYYAVWRAIVSFDGNGADEGQTEPVHADLSGNITLPECGFTRKGYSFAGWVGFDPNEEDYEPTGNAPGTTTDAFYATTYYACWCQSVALPEVSVSAPGTLEGTVEGWGSAMGAACVIVKNDGDATLAVSATFDTYGASGGKVENGMATSVVVAPGMSQLLACRINWRAEKATYTLEAKDPFLGTVAAMDVDVEEVERDKDGIKARIVNNGSASPQIGSVGFVVKDAEGICYVGSEYVGTTLKPGEFAELVITSDSLYGSARQPDWDDVKTTYYVDASYLDEGYWQELLERDLAEN